MKGRNIENTIQFAGLTRHDNFELTGRADRVAGIDAEEPPEQSFANAIRQLKTAQSTDAAWKVPTSVAKRLEGPALERFNAEMPDGIRAYQAETPGGDPAVFVETDRFQPLYSPEVVKDWLRADFREEDGRAKDALWHIPTSDYAITNPVTVYEPLERAIRDEELGPTMWGEIREYKRGGEVHMDLLFDGFQVQNGADADEDEEGRSRNHPIVLGIRTGYDFFGGTMLYAEGFAQQTRCDNSIRNVTDQKTRRSVGDAADDVREWWEDILSELGMMTDHLAEMIEEANGITVDVLEMAFAEPFDHDDDLQALYEHVGFPEYLANHAASHVESRADDQFEPTLWDLHSGATYALTHEYRGTENSSRMNQLVSASNDMVQNPVQFVETVERSHQQALREEIQDGHEQGTLEGHSVAAEVQQFREDLEQQRDEFETRQEQLRNILDQEAQEAAE